MTQSEQGALPKWQKAPADLVQRFETLVRPLPGAELRKMFGYPCAFFQGHMFAGVFQDTMFLRLDAEGRATFLRMEGAAPFAPMASRPMREYVVLPPGMLDRSTEVCAWLDRALAYAATLPPAEPKSKRSRPGKGAAAKRTD